MSLDVTLKTAPSLTVKPEEKEELNGKRVDAPQTV